MIETAEYALLLGLPAAAVATRIVKVRATAAAALLQDAMPIVLVLTWIALTLAIVRGEWLLASVAAVLAAYHVLVVWRLARPDAAPRWVAHAPRTNVVMANVYVDNDDFGPAARQLLEVDADVLVVVETTPAFRAAFDELCGDRYPFRTFDEDDHGEYAVSLYCSAEPKRIGMIDIGELRAASATISVGPGELTVIGAIPMAAVDAGGYEVWRRQLRGLARFAGRSRTPLVITGDLNTTVHRAAFDDLRDAGLADAHDALGEGWRPSFQLSATGLLSKLGPLVRLDHALVNRSAWATSVRDLDSAGSDHRPLVVEVAVRCGRPGRVRTDSTRAGSARGRSTGVGADS